MLHIAMCRMYCCCIINSKLRVANLDDMGSTKIQKSRGQERLHNLPTGPPGGFAQRLPPNRLGAEPHGVHVFRVFAGQSQSSRAAQPKGSTFEGRGRTTAQELLACSPVPPEGLGGQSKGREGREGRMAGGSGLV